MTIYKAVTTPLNENPGTQTLTWSYITKGTEAAGDKIFIGTLPFEARILQGVLAGIDLDADGTVILQIGTLSVPDKYMTDVDYAVGNDATGIASDLIQGMLSNVNGVASNLSENEDLYITSKAGNTTMDAGKSIMGFIQWVNLIVPTPKFDG